MKWTAKTRYALAVLVVLAKADPQTVPLITIAQRLGLSKIYLEQVLAALRSHQLVIAQKGPSGGYRLNGNPSVWDVLIALEPEWNTLPESDFTDERMNILLREEVFGPALKHLRTDMSHRMIRSLADDYTEAPMYYI